MGLAKPEAIRILLTAAGQDATEPRVQRIHDNFTRRMCHFYATDSSVREIPGTATVFGALRHSGIKIALNTGFSRDVGAVLLARLRWQAPGVIDACVTSDEVPRGRPHPDMIRLLMTRLDIHDPKHVAKVGDTPVDLEEGNNAGCGLVIGVTSGSHTREQLQVFPHSHIADSVVDVPVLLGLSQ
jgi:phosphonatase-like hydrolase